MRKFIKNSTLHGMKKIISVILAMCLALTFCGCSFIGEHIVSCIGEMFEEAPGFTYGDFGCCYVRDAKSNRATSKENAVGVNICALLGEAREKETIIIPESIDGLPVIAIGQNGLGWVTSLRINGAKYSKIYFPETIERILDYDITPETKAFFLNKPKYIGYWEDLYIPEKDYVEYEKYFQEKDRIGALSRIHIANLTYLVDEEVYWIDDYEDGQYVQAPSVPSKEGFVFDGWYLDEEFSSEWDFELNQYKKPEDSASLKLYAKFVAEN